jgi:hypothetical protein
MAFDAGEAWCGAIFFVTLLKNPMFVGQPLEAMLGKQLTKSPARHPYAMTVFYNNVNERGLPTRPHRRWCPVLVTASA